jgi:Poly (ADP-ribose) glycohydrolase (PARG)
MNNFSENLICRHTFNAQNLVASHPPKLRNPNKKVVDRIACPPDSIHSGELVFSRWRSILLSQLAPTLTHHPEIEEQKCYFEYAGSNQRDRLIEWYLNFAHFDLFCAYGGPLFAQDEMQVAEHPALASLREALLDANIKPLTVEQGEPTPVLIRCVERRCSIATNPDPALQRPLGLYGNNFAKASTEAIALATTPLQPPTITNIIAMEAPSSGYNFYEYDIIEYILTTAVTGFIAAKIESQLEIGSPLVAIHTGFWGCGAYGGNRVLMALLQLLAARLAQIDRLVFHTTDVSGSKALATAQTILDRDLAISEFSIPEILDKIYAMAFKWGVGDGN